MELEGQNPRKPKSRLLDRSCWLRFIQGTDKNGRDFFACGFYRKGNRSESRVIAHDRRTAEKLWTELRLAVPVSLSDDEKRIWLKQRIVKPPKKTTRIHRGIKIELGTNTLAQKLKKLCERHCDKGISRAAKGRTVKICKELASLAGANESLTPRLVFSFFKSKMNPDNHYSPMTLEHDKSDIRAIARYLGMTERKVDELFRDVHIPTRSQLKDSRIDFGERKRGHLERWQVESLVEGLIQDSSKEFANIRSSIWLQLQTAWRPNEPPCAQILDSSVFLDGTWKNGRKKSLKTASKGIATITVPRDPFLDAYLYLTNLAPGPINTKKASDYFKALVLKTLGNDAIGLDRYCLRHTGLTWMTRSSIPPRVICDTVGHMSMRMLDLQYAHRAPKDQRSWEDAMPLNFKSIPKNWKGFLLECVIAAKWPDLKKGIKPTDDTAYRKLLEILKSADKKREELDLFD